MRVVSLLPSATECLVALGVEPVGVSHSCDHPPRVRELPTITSTAVEHEHRSAAEINAQMQSVNGAVYSLDTDRLATLAPDLVVTQTTCDVCAVDATDVHDAISSLATDPEILALDPHSFDEVISDINQIGSAVNQTDTAAAVTEQLRVRVARLRAQASAAVDNDGRPRTAVLDWTSPLMRAGHWVHDMVEIAGGDPSFQSAEASTPVSWAEIRAYDPEVLVVVPCGFARDRAVTAATELRSRPGWDELTAVRENRVYAIDGNAFFNRPSHRLVDSLAALIRCLHPRWIEPSAAITDRIQHIATADGPLERSSTGEE